MIKVHNGQVKPIQLILSRLFLAMKQIAEEEAKQIITKVVVGIPFKASNMHRIEMLEAAAIAGLDCIKLVEDPVAAVIGSSLDDASSEYAKPPILKAGSHEWQMVIDINARHCAMTVLECVDEQPTVRSHIESDLISGHVIDELLMEMFFRDFK